jgi:hypothetical protein
VFAACERAWPRALRCWSDFLRLRAPGLCLSTEAAATEGLSESFAMIRLHDQKVVLDLERLCAEGLHDFVLEILAHEIGHHVYAPATLTAHIACITRIRAGLPTFETHAPMVANLFTDLLVNDRLQRNAGLAMHRVFESLASSSAGDPGLLWTLYTRIMELLWSRPSGSLGPIVTDERLEGDAWLGARLLRVYATDWVEAAGRFAALVLPYLVEDADAANATLAAWRDTLSAGAGGTPRGELERLGPNDTLHPSLDPRLNEDLDDPASAAAPDPSSRRGAGEGQFREPWEYHEVLRAAGLDLSPHDAAVRYYRELAQAHLVPFPRRRLRTSEETIPEGLEPWAIGDPFDTLDVFESLTLSPVLIPGVTTVRRVHGDAGGNDRRTEPVDLDLYVDSSGSMPDPKVQMSYPALAGAIVALSALRSGSAVQVTVWSGPGQVVATDGFVSDPTHILRTLTSAFQGSTSFPIHALRATYPERPMRKRRSHLLHISDEGIDTLREDGDRPDGTTARESLARCGGGATMVLQLFEDLEDYPALTAFREEGYDVYRVGTLEELLAFAQAFARRHYAPADADAAAGAGARAGAARTGSARAGGGR